MTLATIACSQTTTPKGDVVAIVDGIEITTAIIEAEARTARLSLVGPDATKNRDILLKRAVQRAALVAEAKRRQIPRDPTVLAERAIQEQNLLAARALTALVKPSTKIDEAAVARFIADNPQMFAKRQGIHVDQIRCPAQSCDAAILKNSHSMAAVVELLKQRKVPYERSDPVLDSATLPKGFADRLAAITGGEPAIYTVDGITYVNTLIDLTPIIRSSTEQAAVARNTLASNDYQRQTQQVLDRLQKSATISYQEGFKPR